MRRVRWLGRPCASWSASARARGSVWARRPSARPAGRRVELMIGAPANEAELLAPSIREMLAPKGLNVVTTRKSVVTAQDVAAAIAPPSEATPSLARVLLDFTVAGQATLFLIDPPRGRVYVRRMALRARPRRGRARERAVRHRAIDRRDSRGARDRREPRRISAQRRCRRRRHHRPRRDKRPRRLRRARTPGSGLRREPVAARRRLPATGDGIGRIAARRQARRRRTLRPRGGRAGCTPGRADLDRR